MKILFASDSYKGSLTSKDTIRLLTEATNEVLPECETMGIPIADGGEGTLEAVVEAKNGTYQEIDVSDPLGKNRKAKYGCIEDMAVIEMARASGLPLVPEEKRNPLFTSTYGTGQLIVDALDKGFRKIYIAIGGSATNDGGMGALMALGVKFLDRNGNELSGCGKDLIQVNKIDDSKLHGAVKETTFYVMCDVTNPFIGENGATYVFAPQKGGKKEELLLLENGMVHFANIVENKTKIPIAFMKGAGAAGGLGGSLHAFLKAEMISGIDAVLDIISYDTLIEGVDLVITGEGRFDQQSLGGKAIDGIAKRNQKKGIKTVVLAGSIKMDMDNKYLNLVDSAISTICYPMEVSEACENAEKLYKDAAIRMLKLIKIGTLLK